VGFFVLLAFFFLLNGYRHFNFFIIFQSCLVSYHFGTFLIHYCIKQIAFLKIFYYLGALVLFSVSNLWLKAFIVVHVDLSYSSQWCYVSSWHKILFFFLFVIGFCIPINVLNLLHLWEWHHSNISFFMFFLQTRYTEKWVKVSISLPSHTHMQNTDYSILV